MLDPVILPLSLPFRLAVLHHRCLLGVHFFQDGYVGINELEGDKPASKIKEKEGYAVRSDLFFFRLALGLRGSDSEQRFWSNPISRTGISSAPVTSEFPEFPY